MDKNILTQEYVKYLFDYCVSGHLVWKVKIDYKNNIGDKAGCLGNGYYQVTIKKKKYYIHILIFLWHNGYIPENDVDHEDRNKLNNRIENLREINRTCNIRNTGLYKNNTSGIKGISWYKNSYHPRIEVNYKFKNLGNYKDFDEAVCVRLAAEQCLNWRDCDNNSTAYQYVQKIIKCI